MRDARRRLAVLFSLLLICWFSPQAALATHPKRVLVFGDSLTSGYNLPRGAAFPSALSRRLRHRGNNVLVFNGSEAGDTTSDALMRLPQAFTYGADLVIVELGGNDMLDKVEPGYVYRNLDAIVAQSRARGARVIVAGMLSLPRRDRTYKPRFDAIYPTLAARERVPLYPFFLEGAFGNPRLMQSDGEHPNPFGADLIAARMTPMIERELKTIDRVQHGRRAAR